MGLFTKENPGDASTNTTGDCSLNQAESRIEAPLSRPHKAANFAYEGNRAKDYLAVISTYTIVSYASTLELLTLLYKQIVCRDHYLQKKIYCW